MIFPGRMLHFILVLHLVTHDGEAAKILLFPIQFPSHVTMFKVNAIFTSLICFENAWRKTNAVLDPGYIPEAGFEPTGLRQCIIW